MLAGARRGKRLRRLAKYLFGRGGDYCRGCAKLDAPCSRGLPGLNGKSCPKEEDAPQTPEGFLVRQIGSAPGLLIRAGMTGAVTGLDWASILSMVPADCDRERVISLIREWEIGVLEGASEKAKDTK